MVESDNSLRVQYPENSKHEFTLLNNCKNAIFLAGPCPRNPNEDDFWRPQAIQILKDIGFNGVVLNPTNKYYDESDTNHLEKQTKWEYEAMHKASAIVFWIERSDEHPSLTTNIEFGNWIGKPSVYYGWSKSAIHNSYIENRLNMLGLKRYSTLRSMLIQVVKDLNRKSQKWFLSDTHFSQQRTLELSKRPFINTFEMDMEMISNWNKTIRMNDTVYFLGDFGETFDYLRLLNYGELKFVLGNYERKTKDGVDISSESKKKLRSYKNVSVFDRADLQIELSDGKVVTLVHEPIAPSEYKSDYSDKLYLYGHIHGRSFYKKNGTDVGVDIHGFAPISEDEIIWRLNAIQYLDENVWELNCE